jgi:hypothetical protein
LPGAKPIAAFIYAVAFGTTLFVSAGFLFVAQPMIGKVIMARLGGMPGAVHFAS